MKLIKFLLLAVAFSIFGCAHGLMRGSVAMKTSDSEAHVCLGNNEVKVGDRVTALNNHCHGKGGGRAWDGGDSNICEKCRIGEGTVTALLNQHYSVVKFDEGVKFSEGRIIEKK